MFKLTNQINWITKLFFVLVILFPSYTIQAQQNESILNESRKLLGLSLNLEYGNFRDFSTSPLFYKMPGIGFSVSGIYQTDKNENRFDLEGNILYWNSLLVQLNTYYHYLHKIPVLKNQKWDLKLGGSFHFTQHFRSNAALMNAQEGFESFVNVMAVGKISRDISRLTSRDFTCWFIKGSYKPIKRMISLQMNVGVLNLNHRPSTYNYVYFGYINGSELPLAQFFKEYQWRLNGWRLGAQIDYTWFYPSGNGRKISYIWDAMHAPGSFEPFEMACHKLQFTLLINNKKR